MGALGIPSAADIERVTRRLRSVSQRLEGIEDALDRLEERAAAAPPADPAPTAWRRSRSGSRRSPATSPRCARSVAPGDEPAAARPGAPDGHRLVGRGRSAAASAGLARARTPDAPRAPPALDAARAPSPPGTSRHRRARTRPRRRAARPRAERRRLHLDDRRAAVDPVGVDVRARVVEEVGGDDGRRAARRPRPARAVSVGVGATAPSAPERARSRRRPPARSRRPRARRARSRRERAAGPDPDEPPAPSAISSSQTIAALGPPIPVDWTVSGSPSAAVPV